MMLSIGPGAGTGDGVRITFEQRLADLEAKVLRMGRAFQAQFDETLRALADSDIALADRVIREDEQLDKACVEIEEEILRTLALEAPVAKDLRLVAGILHVNLHIERMGDLCVNIGRFIKLTANYPPAPRIQATLAEMGQHARGLVSAALDCFAQRDVELAERLPLMDQPIDELNERIFSEIELASGEPGLEWASRMVLVARYLERIGDHSVDIGEQVVFIVTGKVTELVPPKAVRAQIED
jgi:phosphate transport system protein